MNYTFECLDCGIEFCIEWEGVSAVHHRCGACIMSRCYDCIAAPGECETHEGWDQYLCLEDWRS